MPERFVSQEEFVEVWVEASLNGQTQSWIASKVGLASSTIAARGRRLRRSGVNLPLLRSARVAALPDQTERLNRIIAKTKREAAKKKE